jgi:hypothetical protein
VPPDHERSAQQPAPVSAAGENFRDDVPAGRDRTDPAAAERPAAEPRPKALPDDGHDDDIFRDMFRSAVPKSAPEDMAIAIQREIPIARLRAALLRLTAEKIRERALGPLVVLAPDITGANLTMAAAICRSEPNAIQHRELNADRFGSGAESSDLFSAIADTLQQAPGSHVVIDARHMAAHPPFWLVNRNLTDAFAACEAAGVRAVVVVTGQDFKRSTTRGDADQWRQYASPLDGIERHVVVALAEEEDDRLARGEVKSALNRRIDYHEASVQEMWDALTRGELSAFVDELEKGHESSRAGRREELFRRVVINLETRNPAQASALFLGSFLPDLKKQTFLEAHQHLHTIAGSHWRPRKKDKRGEIEKWDPAPTDFDRETVGVTFESNGVDPILRARMGGDAAVQQFRALFVKIGAEALRLFIDDGLTTFPLLASGDDKALTGLVSISEEKFRREHASPLQIDSVRRQALAFALTYGPQALERAEIAQTVNAVATYLSELAERLPVAQSPNGDSLDGTTSALKLLLADLLEIARGYELSEQGVDWLHDSIARTAFVSPALRWRAVFCEIYEDNARFRQRTLLTNRFWPIIINAARDRPDLLRSAMIEAAKRLAEPDVEEWIRSFRLQLFSRLLTVWLYSATAAAFDKGAADPRGAGSADGSNLLEEGFIRTLANPLFTPAFVDGHFRLGEVEASVLVRTRGSHEDAAVLARVDQPGQIMRIVRSTCLAVLHVLLPLDIAGQDQRAFLDRFAACVDQLDNRDAAARRGGFFAAYRWTNDNGTGATPAPASSFEQAVQRWLAAAPLAVILAERDLTSSATSLSEIMSRVPSPRVTARLLGRQIDALRPDLQCAREALGCIAGQDARRRADAFLSQRRSELAKLRNELLATIRNEAGPGQG